MKVLFRPTYLQLDLLMGVVWVVGAVYCIVKMIRFTRKHDHQGLILTILITAIFGSLAVYCTAQIVRSTAHMIVTAHRTDYQTVVGYVKNYQLTPVGAHDKESFEIDGVPFSYPPSGNTWFYHTPRSAGGVIRGNGQYLEIHYFTFPVEEGNQTDELNCIIYIAEDEEKSICNTEGGPP